jgi:hypothetical protein
VPPWPLRDSFGGDCATELDEVSSGGIGRVVTTCVTVLEKNTSSRYYFMLVSRGMLSRTISLTAPNVWTRREILDRTSSGMLS